MVERVRLNPKAKPSAAEVGYGKPPKHTRFKKGQSGNPKGRPKGTCNFKTDVQAMLKSPVKITNNGRVSQMSTQRASLETLRAKGFGGHQRSLEQVLRYGEKYDEPEAAADAPLDASDQAILDAYVRRVMQKQAKPSPD